MYASLVGWIGDPPINWQVLLDLQFRLIATCLLRKCLEPEGSTQSDFQTTGNTEFLRI